MGKQHYNLLVPRNPEVYSSLSRQNSIGEYEAVVSKLQLSEQKTPSKPPTPSPTTTTTTTNNNNNNNAASPSPSSSSVANPVATAASTTTTDHKAAVPPATTTTNTPATTTTTPSDAVGATAALPPPSYDDSVGPVPTAAPTTATALPPPAFADGPVPSSINVNVEFNLTPDNKVDYPAVRMFSREFSIPLTAPLESLFLSAKGVIKYEGEGRYLRKATGQELQPGDTASTLSPPLSEGETITLVPARPLAA